MSQKIKKAQVVISAIDPESQNFSFLLLQTNERRGSFWQNVTGKLEGHETFEEGAFREAMEETKFRLESIIDILSLDLTYEFIDQRERSVHEECFLFLFEGKWEVEIDPSEHQGYKWVHIEHVSRESVKHLSNFECLEKSIKLLKGRGR